MVNFKSAIFFADYIQQENTSLRLDFSSFVHFGLTTYSNRDFTNKLSLARSFHFSANYDFVRFYNLLSFAFPRFNPLVSKVGTNFYIRLNLISSSAFAYTVSKLYKLSTTTKSSFINLHYDLASGSMRIVEPHVVFNASSPYFDYHGSHLSLSFFFRYNYTNPHVLNIFNLFFANTI